MYTDECILYSGAFRAGKTLLLANASAIICLSHNKVKGCLGSQTSKTLKTVVLSLVQDELDKYQEKLDKAGIDLKLVKYTLRSEGNMETKFFNDSLIYYRQCDDERKLAGMTLDFFGLDEPVDMAEGIFTQLIGRISGTGNLSNTFGMLTTNPSSELHWIYKYFYLMKLDRYSHVDTCTYDNVLLPNYDKYIKSKEAAWDKDWVRRYLNGQWGMFEGQIYKEFLPEKIVGDYEDLPVKEHICGIDWGLQNPHCVLDIGITNDNRLVVLREHYGTKMTTDELSKLIAEWHKDVKFSKVYIDPSAADLIQQCYERGVPCATSKSDTLHGFADNDVQNGIAKVQSLLRQKLILVNKICINYIKEMMAYRYQEGTEKPIKENDHACDAFRYGVTDFNPDGKCIGFKGLVTDLFRRRR